MGSKGKQYGPNGETYASHGLNKFEKRHRKLLPEMWFENYYGVRTGPNMGEPDPQYVNSNNGHVVGDIVMSRSVWPKGHGIDTWGDAFNHMIKNHYDDEQWKTTIGSQGPLTWSKRGINNSVSTKPRRWMAVGYMTSWGSMTFKNMGMMWEGGTYELGDEAYNQFMGQLVPPPSINQQVINRRIN